MTGRRMLGAVLTSAVMAVALSGVAAAQDDDAFPAENVQWMLDSYADSGSAVAVPDGVRVTLLMFDREASGLAGCNSYFGSYVIDESSLSFGPLGVTAAICEDPAQSVEDAYLPLLDAVTGWTIDDATLNLSDESGAVILSYREAAIDITATDVVALTTELEGLQAQIDALGEQIASQKVASLRNRVAAIEANVDSLQEQVDTQNVPQLRKRVARNEAVLNDLSDRFVNLRARVNTLEKQVKALDKRLAAVEEQLALKPVPLPE